MNRIFLSLVVTTFVLLGGTLILGLATGDVHNPADELARKMKQVHFMAGVFTAVFVILVHSIVVTWFIGTSRWCKEVVEAYRIDRKYAVESARLKRRTFPFAVLSMLAIVGVAALGACSDPAAALQVQPPSGIEWHTVHLMSALVVIAFIGYAFWTEWCNISANSVLVATIMQEVRQIRLERGLDVDQPAVEEPVSSAPTAK